MHRCAVVILLFALGLMPACQRRPDTPDQQGYTPLMRAAQRNDLEEIDRLLAAGANPNYQGRLVERPSLLFPFRRHVTRDVPHHSWTPLVVAVRNGNLASVKRLIRAGADINTRVLEGMPLDMAIEDGHVDIVRELLAAGAALREGHPNAPLVLAIQKGNLDIVKLIAPPQKREHAFHPVLNALALAAQQGKTNIVQYLIGSGAISIPRAVAMEHEGILIEAVGHGYSSVAKIPIPALIDPKAIGPTRDKGEMLLDAIGRGDIAALELARANGVDLNGPLGTKLLSAAAAAGHKSLAQAFAEAGAPINAADRNGISPLMLASMSGEATVVTGLLAAGALPDLRDERGKTALMHAAIADAPKAIEVLLDAGANIEALDQRQWTALMIALHQNRSNAAEALIRRGASKIASQNLKLIAAVENNDIAKTRDALSAGANPNVRANAAEPLLVLATKNEEPELAEALIKAGADVDANINQLFYSPLRLAVLRGNETMVQILLNHGADPNSPNYQGDGTLFIAAVGGDESMLRIVIRAGADVHRKNQAGQTILSQLTAAPERFAPEASSKIGLLLREAGAALAGPETELIAAASHGNTDRVRQLFTSSSPEHREHALVAAASFGWHDTVAFLLNQGVDANGLVPGIRTPLAAAISSGSVDIARLLLTANADPNLPSQGVLPAQIAAETGHNELIELLAAAGATQPQQRGDLQKPANPPL